MASSSCAGIWTNGKVTVVLANVCVAYWGKEDGEGGTIHVTPEEASAFVVETTGGEVHYFADSAFREGGVEFLRALSLYWETRT